ncbi:MAG TPA: hypothetical protein VIK59_06505 [Verrucomicrobiae bacterium]
MFLIHVTVAYSNAVLVAILPHISDCAKKLDLPIPAPVTASQVAHFNISPWEGEIGGGLWLTNHYFFSFTSGYVSSFRSPTNWFNNTYDNWDDLEYFKRYRGRDNMTTNEAIELARDSFRKLGYKPEEFQADGPPTSFEGPINSKRLGHMPYCRIEWNSPNSKIRNWLGLDSYIQFDIDMQRKQIVGMNLISRRFWRSDPKITVTPDLETNYRNAGVFGQMALMQSRMPYVHMTPAYSNATLTATLPYVADFTKKLNLPISQPLIGDQVLLYLPPLYYTNDGFSCTVMLTNHFWFTFLAGFVTKFSSPDDWFEESQTKTNWAAFDQNCLTTNEAIEFARDAFQQLGYHPEDFHLDNPPTSFENAVDKKNERYAYCRMDWESSDEMQTNVYQIQFDIDLLRKRIVGATLIGKKFVRPLPKIDVVPELESDYRRHISGKMFIRAKAPDLIRTSNPSLTHLKKSSPGIQTNPAAPPVR